MDAESVKRYHAIMQTRHTNKHYAPLHNDINCFVPHCFGLVATRAFVIAFC